MYAELLEMKDIGTCVNGAVDDSLPEDLETGWVAVGAFRLVSQQIFILFICICPNP